MSYRRIVFAMAVVLILNGVIIAQTEMEQDMSLRFPADGAVDVNPDTHLVLTFDKPPRLGTTGQVRIYDTADDRLVDTLDLSIPPGPTDPNKVKVPYTTEPYEYISGNFTNANTKPGTPSGTALPTSDKYQLTIIGGFTDAFHFYPIIIHNNTATIYPHNNLLEYDKTYYVQIDPGVLTVTGDKFKGISGKTGWTFSTKKTPLPAGTRRLVVSADGTGDFNTVQGAVDFIPDYNSEPVTVFIKNGDYEEIVYFRNKTNITFVGENREKVRVHYANNEVFNPHPSNVATNEWPGTFPSRRAAFMVDHSKDIALVNMTIETTAKGQAEGLLLAGERILVCDVTIVGSGDALQANGSVYLKSCSITGDGDNILGRGPVFFDRCAMISTGGVYMWIRNTETNHGNVFVNCSFKTLNGRQTEIARAPVNKGREYPYAEAVLINCALEGIRPIGWGRVGGDTSNMHYWEYNSTNLSDGSPVDVSARHPVSRQLTMPEDAEIIANYSDPAYVLGGWKPMMAPILLSQPENVRVAPGQDATFRIKVAAVPDATYQWFKDGKAIEGATDAILTLKNIKRIDTAGDYTVTVTNEAGSVTSKPATLTIKADPRYMM